MRKTAGSGPDRDTQRVLDGLSAALRTARVPRRALERKLGWSAGYVSRVLNGPIKLQSAHLFAILRAIGKSPEEFFRETFPPQLPYGASLPAASEAAAPGAARPQSELSDMDRHIRQVVLELLQELLRGAGGDPPAPAPPKR